MIGRGGRCAVLAVGQRRRRRSGTWWWGGDRGSHSRGFVCCKSETDYTARVFEATPSRVHQFLGKLRKKKDFCPYKYVLFVTNDKKYQFRTFLLITLFKIVNYRFYWILVVSMQFMCKKCVRHSIIIVLNIIGIQYVWTVLVINKIININIIILHYDVTKYLNTCKNVKYQDYDIVNNSIQNWSQHFFFRLQWIRICLWTKTTFKRFSL